MEQWRFDRNAPESFINILFLGETGVGKTTFINAFSNYIFYNTLDEALKGDLKVLIPSSFSITDKDQEKSIVIRVGEPNDNENMDSDGASSTQSCRSYVFKTANRFIRLIDGPGVGDTRGVDHEARNFDNILRYISNYEHLNGICILLKPTVTRLNVYFRYCIKELLRHLHINAKDNIMFVFTNSRAAFYRPGDTTPILRSLLRELREKTGVEVPFNHENTFMIDNEAFRFLAVCKQGLNNFMGEKRSYAESWEKSAREVVRLIGRIHRCDLHAVKDMRSLNEAQILIQRLSRPIAEITKLIQENISLAKEYKEKLSNNQSQDISSKLPQKTGQFVPLKERLTVCVNEKCTEVITVNDEQRINYRSNCHVGCSLHSVVQECIGHPIIRRCRALRATGACRNCRCDWTKHMHITYRYEKNLTHLELSSSRSSRTPQSIMILIDNRISDLRREERSIRQICVKLSQFLKANSITPFNDEMLEYLRHFLKEEQQKQAAGANNRDIIRGLQQMIVDYTNELELLTKSISVQNNETENKIDNSAQIETIFDLIGELYELPLYGKFIKEQVDRVQEGQVQVVAKAEQFVTMPRSFDSLEFLTNLIQSIKNNHN